jgi:hypothetical protein
VAPAGDGAVRHMQINRYRGAARRIFALKPALRRGDQTQNQSTRRALPSRFSCATCCASRGALHDGDHVHYPAATSFPFMPAGPYRVDFALQYEQIRVALEIDGFAFHSSQASMLRDYQRARRLQLGGYVLVRVTAGEAMTMPRRCWKDALGILRVRTSIERFA